MDQNQSNLSDYKDLLHELAAWQALGNGRKEPFGSVRWRAYWSHWGTLCGRISVMALELELSIDDQLMIQRKIEINLGIRPDSEGAC